MAVVHTLLVLGVLALLVSVYAAYEASFHSSNVTRILDRQPIREHGRIIGYICSRGIGKDREKVNA